MRLAFLFALAITLAVAPLISRSQGKAPTAEECKKNPKQPGCDKVKK